MERKFEGANTVVRSQGILQTATETFMANLPIIVLSFVVALTIAGEIFL